MSKVRDNTGGDTLPRERVSVGGRAWLHVVAPADPRAYRPLVYCVSASGVRRLLPPAEGPWPTLERFPEEDGARVIEVTICAPPGVQTFIVGLLPAREITTPWSEGDGRDEWVRESVLSGQIPGTVARLLVA